MTEGVSSMVNHISAWVDDHLLERMDEDTVLWHRVAKVGEESGEVIAALIGATNGNPRKPNDQTMKDVQNELLDLALCALCAWSHTTGNKGDSLAALRRHAIKIRNRAGLRPS